jgi:hypothetical protein
VGTGQRAPTGPARAGGGRLGVRDCRCPTAGSVGDPVAVVDSYDSAREPTRSVCRVALWRGYVTARFYVWTDGGTLLESESFRAVRAGMPYNRDAARSAYDGLVARLQAAGWVRVEDGDPWWASRFERSDTAPAQPRTDGSGVDDVSTPSTSHDAGQARTEPRRPGMMSADQSTRS